MEWTCYGVQVANIADELVFALKCACPKLFIDIGTIAGAIFSFVGECVRVVSLGVLLIVLC